MAWNDYHVLVYCILSYLYRCLKSGEMPNGDDVSAAKLGIPYSYWTYIMRRIEDEGFVDVSEQYNDETGKIVSYAESRRKASNICLRIP